MRFAGAANELLPVKDVDRDQIRLLARREVVAVLRRERRTLAEASSSDPRLSGVALESLKRTPMIK